jgi:hyperosmotically inducible periplasmic protein
MKKHLGCLLITGAVAVASLFLSTGCSVTRGQQNVGAYAKDKEIAAQIKTAMYADPVVKGTQVEVTTFNGVVQLSGFVNNEAEKKRAGEIAASTPGVTKVYNNLILPTGAPSGDAPQAPIVR